MTDLDDAKELSDDTHETLVEVRPQIVFDCSWSRSSIGAKSSAFGVSSACVQRADTANDCRLIMDVVAVGALLLSGNRGRAPSFASEAQASWMIFSSRRFEKLDYSIEEQYRAQPYAWTRNQIELPWS